ncbi:MAG TPA: alpha/beta hydrolase [Acidimicrobiia bacterium]|nr:alpha/beta hydrolase [Acidimicrobiia bacterium]
MHRRRWWPIALPPLAGGAGWLTAHLRSPAVRAWRRPSLPAGRAGRLFTRMGGEGHFGVLLLHGLVATGDVFAVTADEMAAHHRVAVPDLAGFGRSLDQSATDFGTEAHLAALEAVIDEVLGERPLLIGAHSLGSTLALRLADRMAERVERVVCVGAPIWSDPRAAVGAAGPMARALLLDERVAARACRWMCRHRRAGGWLAAAAAPRWPIPIARQASLHTWPAYQQTMQHQVLDVDWPTLLTTVGHHGVRVTLAWGRDDTIGDPSYAQGLVERLDTIDIEIITGADHTAPTARPELLAARLRGSPPGRRLG